MEEEFLYNLFENKFTVLMCCVLLLLHQNQTIAVFINRPIPAYLIKAVKTKAVW